MSLALSSVAPAAPVAREADALAAANWRANAAALAATQPGLVERLGPSPDVRWIFGRDGALTAQDRAGAWWAGCSVPAAAAKAMLKAFACNGAVACFLRPPTGAAVRIALDKLRGNRAILALMPDVTAARVMLHCEDFATDVRQHRLWLAVGEDWETQLASLLRGNEGLPVPSQFVRLSDGHEELAEAMIPPAQQIFSEVTRLRAAAIGRLVEQPTAAPSRLACVIAPSHFRLWDDAGHALAQLARQIGWLHVDPDDPACASPLAMARAASQCGAVITPNTARADLPNVIAPSTPWITWLTGPRIPAFAGAGPRDALIVAAPLWRDAAVAAGWPAARVHLATWPPAQLPPPPPPKAPLLVVADLLPLDPPGDVVEMSSQRLLWEAIADELTRDPFLLGPSVLDYLNARMRHIDIAPGALDHRRFIDDVIVPAYARGLADLLRRNGLPLRCAGEGWDAVEMLQPFAVGPVATREALRDAVASSAALVHVLPTGLDHPIAHQGRPLVSATTGADRFLSDARAAAAGKLAAPAVPLPDLSAELLLRVVAAV